MKTNIPFLLLLLISITTYCQPATNNIIGRYSDGITNLTINADSTFDLNTPDYVYPYTYNSYQSRGTWTSSGNVITLNPGKEKRYPGVSLTEKEIEGNDSIQIKINYLTEVYDNEIMVSKKPASVELMTLHINNQYRNLVHSPIHRICAFAPRVKKQMVLDSSNTVKFPKQKVVQLGIFTYGFDKKVELHPSNPNTNYFTITIVQPLDQDRRPRSKKVIIKGKYAWYYELNGKVRTSGLLMGLKRIEH